jgi:hypothetical protein
LTARVRVPTAILGLVALGGSGCAPNSVDAPTPVTPVAAESCRPAETNSLADGFSAADLAGSWSLWLFADEGDATAAAGGRLELVAWEPGDEPLIGGAPAALHGATDVDLEAVGAADSGDASSEALDRPGILVLQWREPGAERPSVALRLGDRSNRLDRMVVDDSYNVLRVTEAADSTFAGRWESGAGRGPVAAGRFCAVRELPFNE